MKRLIFSALLLLAALARAADKPNVLFIMSDDLRGGTLLDTRGGGRSEVLGGFSHTTTAGKLAPMFVNTDSSVWAFFGEICYSGDPFAVPIREARGAETKTIWKNDGHTTPYSGRAIQP